MCTTAKTPAPQQDCRLQVNGSVVRTGGPLFVVGLTIMFCSLCSALLYPVMNDSERANLAGAATALQAVQLVLALLGLVALGLVNGTDPGTVRAGDAPPELEADAAEEGDVPSSRVRGAQRVAASTGVAYKWCDTCALWRPPRASHCGMCGRCFERYDHHCPWVGTCVARQNHRYFAAFLVSIGLTGLTVVASLVLGIYALVADDTERWSSVAVVVMLVFSCCSCCWFGGLCAFGAGTCFMLCANITTKEMWQEEMQSNAASCPALPSGSECKQRCVAGCEETACAPTKAREHQRCWVRLVVMRSCCAPCECEC